MSAPTDLIVGRWASSGLAHLTGYPRQPGDCSRAKVLARADSVLRDFTENASSGPTTFAGADAASLLTGRAGLRGARRRGRISVGGSARLIRTRDEWIALSLARDADQELLPALLRRDFSVAAASREVAWQAVETSARAATADSWITRCRMLGLAASVLGETAPGPPVARPAADTVQGRGPRDLLVVDLSSLWAGPLCTRLLADAGALVVKVESVRRPDGTRSGNPEFFRWLHAGKLSYGFEPTRDAAGLRALLGVADVIVEASRPSAMQRRALDVAGAPRRPGRVWLRISAHGSVPDASDRIGYGDDAAVAGGLVAWTSRGPAFCGDAIADPLTGIEGAHAVVCALRRGGGTDIDLTLAGTAATYAAEGVVDAPPERVHAAYPSAPREPSGHAPRLGADNELIRGLIADRLDGGPLYGTSR